MNYQTCLLHPFSILRNSGFILNSVSPLNLPINLGSEVKSLLGTGIFLTMYSHITSMLYFSWADTGIIGAPSAIVPGNEKTYIQLG